MLVGANRKHLKGEEQLLQGVCDHEHGLLSSAHLGSLRRSPKFAVISEFL